MTYEIHDFYCMNCGKKAMMLPRKRGHLHKSAHRKKLYCIWCKCEVNHMEIRNAEEEAEFLENFKNGVYKDEVADSLAVCGNSRLG